VNRCIAVLAAALLALTACSSAAPPPGKAPEQAVIVHFDYGRPDWAPFFVFEKELEDKVTASGAGDYDGNELEVGGRDGSLYMYGPDADKLFAVVKPILQSSTLLKNVVVTLRYGAADDKNARERTVPLGS
jgi:hypothetical protein